MSAPPTDLPSAPVTLRSPSSIALIVAHVPPMVGVLFFGWNIGNVLLLAWGEAAVVGVYTLIKVAMVDRRVFFLRGPFLLVAMAFLLVPLLVIALALVHEVNKLQSGSYTAVDYRAMAWGLAPVLGGFVVSHGMSFVLDFIGRREYETRSSEDIAKAFFRRAMLLLVVVFAAAFVLSAIGNVGGWLVIVIAFKLAIDLAAHLGEHQPA